MTYTDGCMNYHAPDDEDAFCPFCVEHIDLPGDVVSSPATTDGSAS